MAHVIWLTGPSGSGKTTLALRLEEEFRKRKLPVEVLDGDLVRDFFESDLGFSRAERIQNVKRIAFAAMLLAKNGTHTIVANIAPYYEVRDFIRRRLKNYLQIYVKASVQSLKRRDVKGHYARAAKGEMKEMVGLDDPYDVPRRPDLVIETDKESVDDSVRKIVSFCEERGIFA